MSVRAQLLSLLYGVLSNCNGLREICEGLLGCEEKLIHSGMDKAPPRSTLPDAIINLIYQFYESLYFELLSHYHHFISDSRLKGLTIRNLKIIDSNTSHLFSDILRGIGRNTKDGSRKKDSIKALTIMDAFSGVGEFVRIYA